MVIDWTSMSADDIVYAISKGIPGAVTVLCKIMDDDIDPDDLVPLGMSKIAIIDMLGIYGSDLWTLYKHVCNEEIKDLILVLRAYQLGYITADHIRDSICMKTNLLKMDHLLELVKSQLPNFNY